MGLGNLATIAELLSLCHFALDPIEGLQSAIYFSEKISRVIALGRENKNRNNRLGKKRVFDKHCLLDNYMIKGSFHDAAYKKEQTLCFMFIPNFLQIPFFAFRGDAIKIRK